ncbi:MAG: alpha-2-macroglobulin family protein [Akkermansia sp.]|nr:alpha-2-macroglobulin family protein [Akkermansia sp.]
MKLWVQMGVALAAVPGMLGAAEESFYQVTEESEQLLIRFEEPVVTSSALYTNDVESAEGLQVSAGSKPVLRWTDQDELTVTFERGTVPGATYRLELPEEKRRYLSGKALPGGVVEFVAPPCRVKEVERPGVSWGIPGGAVLLQAEQAYYRNAAFTAVASGAEYRFAVLDSSGQVQQEVPGRARAARAEELPDELVAACMGEATAADWAALTPQSPVPGVVMVEPVEDLSGCRWELRMQHPQGVVQWSEREMLPEGCFEKELRCLPRLIPVVQEGRVRLYMELCFGAPVAAAEAEEIFRKLGIAGGEVVAEPAADGRSKVLKLAGQEIRFTYAPPPSYRGYAGRGKEAYVELPCRLVGGVGMWVEGVQQLPVPLRLTLPAGTKAAGGLCMQQEQQIPFALNPLMPVLPWVEDGWKMPLMLMPLHGAHGLKMHCVGSSELVVRAARLDAEQYLRLRDCLKTLISWGGIAADEDARDALFSLFGDEKVFSPALPTLGVQEVELPLDEVPGFGQKPGVYVLSVKARPDAAQQVLTAPGETTAPQECERYYVLLVTDMKAYALGDRVLAVRLSDGSPIQQGEVKIYADVRAGSYKHLGSFPLGEKVVASESSIRDVVLVQSGEDFTPTVIEVWLDASESEKAGERVSLFADRGVYRPGDTLHLGVMVRGWDAAGKLALPPAGQELRVTIRKGEQLCHEGSLKLDAYGSAYLDWQLPKEAEAAVGDYEVTVTGADGVRGGLSVECEEYRRDSFDVQGELVADAVRPERVTLRVQACGFDGLPPADAVLHAHVEMGDDEYELNLPLDAAGCVVHELTPGERPEWAAGESCELSVSGSVSNGRHEYVRLPHLHKTLCPADFCIWGVCEVNDMAPVIGLTRAGAAGMKPLERAQELELSLLAPVLVPEKLPNGVVFYRMQEQCVWQQSITVPAHCQDGVKPVSEQLLHRLREEREKKMGHVRHFSPRLKVKGVDPAGNRVEETLHLSCHRARSGQNSVCKRVEARVQGRELLVSTRFGSGGRAVVLLCTSQGLHRDVVEVQAGEQELRLPLPAGVQGRVAGALLLPLQKNGSYSRAEVLSFDVNVPMADNSLKVEWQLPQGAQAPGTRVQVGGRVLGADGSPVAHAAVCLWAVDVGMLSVSRYTLPEPWEVFLPTLPAAFCMWHGVGEYPFTLPQLYKVEPKVVPFRRDPLWCEYAHSSESGISVSCGFTGGAYRNTWGGVSRAYALAEVDSLWEEGGLGLGCGLGGSVSPSQLRLRRDFTPTPLWQPALLTDAEGCFSVEMALPDTLTTYRVMAVVQGADGCSFGNGAAELVVQQPVMLTPGTPLFMSVGDALRLPVSLTNNTAAAGTWTVSMQGDAAPQQVSLAAGESATLYFDVTATAEGERTLQWQAVSENGGDAVQGCFPVRFPAPVLQAAHHLALRAGDAPLKVHDLLAPELRGARDLRVEAELCAAPLQQLQSCLGFALSYPYGCTEQRASNLLPWLLQERLAPYCPDLQKKSKDEVRAVVEGTIATLLSRQQKDGGLSYWNSGESCYWASAQAALVLSFAAEAGYEVPAEAQAKLRTYLLRELTKQDKPGVFTRYAVGRACGDLVLADAALAEAAAGQKGEIADRFSSRLATASLRLLADLRKAKADFYPAFNRWLRTVGGEKCYLSTWDSGWVFIALHEFLHTTPLESEAQATLTTASGRVVVVGREPVTLSDDEAATLTPVAGTAYLTVKAKALPEKTDYPGVTEKGLQITRIYEKRGADGVWREAREFNVGDVVRVTLTCAKSERELEYFVLEDYLPACMEAINPNVPSQAAGLEWSPWSHWFDHKEYLSYRVRGFCTRWGGRDLLNMSYFARVKRAGTSTAPPAQAQLMYEPQTYGLSPNAVIISH